MFNVCLSELLKLEKNIIAAKRDLPTKKQVREKYSKVVEDLADSSS